MMNEEPKNQTGPKQRQRLLQQLDRMVESGRVTEGEASKLRASEDSDAFDETVRSIRERHAAPKLQAAVEGGHMTQEEADANLARIRQGDHLTSLRSQLRKWLPGERRNDSKCPGSAG